MELYVGVGLKEGGGNFLRPWFERRGKYIEGRVGGLGLYFGGRMGGLEGCMEEGGKVKNY